ncbi:SMC-Scp complex subunit ScpB [Kytococcus sedentarius]|uniref:SMC-Scp complex subunit ScpB n=1 Tax=Kytococcus sedentarius TaxID=1276 RepID=UPI0035BC5202
MPVSDPQMTPETPAPVDTPLQDLPAALEAVLMVVDEPVTPQELAEGLGAPVDAVESCLANLSATYTAQGRGFDLRSVAGAWRMYSRPEHADAVERFLIGGRQARLTQAALETLAVIAYRQPISRGRVAAVRGVNVDGVVRTLTARGLIAEVGSEPSGAVLYGTTHQFLERMGLDDLSGLPDLAPFLPDAGDLEEIASGIGLKQQPPAPDDTTQQTQESEQA